MTCILRCCFAGVVTLALAYPTAAHAKPVPVRVAPTKKRGKQRRAERRTKDQSNGGQRNGGIEFTLGAVTAALTVALVGRGGWEYSRLRRFERNCATNDGSCGSAERRDYKIATGLSFGFAVPTALASTFLFIYAVRINRDYKRFKAERVQLRLTPTANGHTGGFLLDLRF